MLGAYNFNNNVKCTLNGAIVSGDDAFELNDSVAPFNNPPNDGGIDEVFTFLDNLASPTKIEIVKASGVINGVGGVQVSGVLRGQEGTTAQDWPDGTIVIQSATKSMLLTPPVDLDLIGTLGVGSNAAIGGALSVGSSATVNGALTANGTATVNGALTASNGLLSTKTAPVNSSSSGATKEIRFDTNYIYVCVGTNNWKRVALSVF